MGWKLIMLKTFLFVLGSILCLPLLIVLINMYWWSLTDTWLFSLLVDSSKVTSALIFLALAFPVFGLALGMSSDKKQL
jgi:hypothetical protein